MREEWVDKGGYQTKLLADGKELGMEGTQVQLVRLTKGKHAHYHRKKTEAFYFLKGRGRAIIDGSEREIAPGTFILVEPNQRHTFINEQEEPLEGIMFKTNDSPEDTYTD